MQPVLNVEDVRHVERDLTSAGVSISELMHRAGSALANEVLRLDGARSAVVLCGLGNNGGDGWVCAERLLRRGMQVVACCPVAPDEIDGPIASVVAKSAADAGVTVKVAPARDELEALLAQADVCVDALLGTGFHGEVRTPFDIWIDCINSSACEVVSADVPSGLSAQTGLCGEYCVVADMTVTMLCLKPGLLSDRGRDMCGSIVVAPLAEQTERLLVENDPVAWRAELSDYVDVIEPSSAAVDKFSRGSVLVVGGSSRFPGAPMMAAMAAARAGAGYVTLAVPMSILQVVQSHMLEIPVVGLPAEQDGTFSPEAADIVRKLAEKRDATLVGPGMRVGSGAVGIVSALLATDRPLVVDADGLNCIARLTSNHLDEYPELIRRAAPLVFTPHRGELARLVGLEDHPLASLTSALDAARRIVWADGGSELCVVAKGSATACVSVDAAILPKPGPASLATAGSGDVLGGVIASLLAQEHADLDEEDLPLLCSLACEVHGYAGSLAAEAYGSRGVMARDVIVQLGLAMDALERDAAFGDDD